MYVGITSQSIKVRWQNGNGYIKCKTFYRAIRKYGWENMKHVIVSSNLGEKTAKNMEEDLIGFYKNRGISYNITEGGEGALGRVVSKYSSAKEAANVIGVSSNTISKACRGLIKSLRGFIFMYEDCGEEPYIENKQQRFIEIVE